MSDEPITFFVCGPNRKCDHVYDRDEPILDSEGKVCGETKVCSKCGASAFQESQWD